MSSLILNLKDQNKEDLLKETLEKVKLHQNKCNSFVTILENAKTKKEGISPLLNIPYVLKDNVSTKDVLTTGSSNSLKNYIPPYSATVYQKLENAGAICVAKSVMDEFGMGGCGITGHTGIVKNPIDTTRIVGGSSSGSAASVCDGVVPFAIGTDTGDSIRRPASYCGIVGYKPTYGMISRYGILPYASSMDHVGVLTKSVRDASIVVDLIKGIDEHDMTSWDSSDIHLENNIDGDVENKKLCYIEELVDINNYENPSDELRSVLALFFETLEKIKQLGIIVEGVSINKDLLYTIPSVYTCISCAEATSNMSNLTGIIFGPRGSGANIKEMMMDHRTKGFSPLIKRRFVIGSYVLQKENQEKYFVNAARVRNRIVNIMKEYFKEYDAYILPSCSGVAPKIEDAKDVMRKSFEAVLDNHMVIGNFGGFPSISIPNGLINGLPVGICITSNIKDDAKLLNIAYKIEEIIDFKGGINHE